MRIDDHDFQKTFPVIEGSGDRVVSLWMVRVCTYGMLYYSVDGCLITYYAYGIGRPLNLLHRRTMDLLLQHQ